MIVLQNVKPNQNLDVWILRERETKWERSDRSHQISLKTLSDTCSCRKRHVCLVQAEGGGGRNNRIRTQHSYICVSMCAVWAGGPWSMSAAPAGQPTAPQWQKQRLHSTSEPCLPQQGDLRYGEKQQAQILYVCAINDKSVSDWENSLERKVKWQVRQNKCWLMVRHFN